MYNIPISNMKFSYNGPMDSLSFKGLFELQDFK